MSPRVDNQTRGFTRKLRNDEIIRELASHSMIERGLKDSDEGCTISIEERQRRINRLLIHTAA